MTRRVTGTGIALALAGTTDEGRSDAAKLARGARRLRVRTTQLAPPVRAVVDLSDDEEPSVPTLAAIAAQADRATTREGMLRAAAELALYAGQVSAMLADEDAVEGSTLDMVEALTLATALARKAGAL